MPNALAYYQQGQEAVANNKRNKLLQMQVDAAPAEQERRNRLLDLQAQNQEQSLQAGQQEFQANQYKLDRTKELDTLNQGIAAAGYIIDSKTPKREAEERHPEIVQQLRKEGFDWDSLNDDDVRELAGEIRNQFSSKAGVAPPETFTKVQGPRGSVIEQSSRTGALKQVVGPDNTETTPRARYQQLSQAEVENLGLPKGSQAQRDLTTGKIDLITKPSDASEKITDGQRKTNGFVIRMEAAEPKVGNYVPSTSEYAVFNKIMKNTGGFFSSATAGELNKQLSPQARQYFQAVSDWARAKLRNESGAVIGADEMLSEISTYFPLPGDDPGTIAQKVEGRNTALDALREQAGPAGVRSQERRTATTPASAPTGQIKKQVSEGQTARNPKTGQRIQFRGGKWVPIAG